MNISENQSNILQNYFYFACWELLQHAFLSSADIFLQKKHFQKKKIRGNHQRLKQFGSRSCLTIPGLDLGPNCLQRFLADDIGR